MYVLKCGSSTNCGKSEMKNFYQFSHQKYCVLPDQAKTTRNQPKRAETSRNDSKPAETTQNNCKTTQNDPKFQNWENLEFSASFRFSNFVPKCPNLGILGKEVSDFQNFKEILSVLYFEGAAFKSDIIFQNFEPKCLNLGILVQKVSTF